MELIKLNTEYARLPSSPDEVFFDHLAHFVRDMDQAAAELGRAGFTLTPFMPQTTHNGPAGTANRCIMLEEGYVKILTPSGIATAMSQQMDAAIARYVGPHLLAFSVTDTEAKAAELRSELFHLLDPIELSRQVVEEDGSETELRFSVLRLQPGQMREGRIQYLTHLTPEGLLQPHYLKHENGAVTLLSTLLGVDDVQEAAHRYSRFFGRPPEEVPGLDDTQAVKFTLDRGKVTLTNPQIAAISIGGCPCPDIPCIPAYTLGFRDLPATLDLWAQRGFDITPTPCGGVAIDCAGAKIIAFPG